MCRPATCTRCGKATWAGCGQHVEAVLGTVPSGQRCSCEPAARRGTGERLRWRLFRR